MQLGAGAAMCSRKGSGTDSSEMASCEQPACPCCIIMASAIMPWLFLLTPFVLRSSDVFPSRAEANKAGWLQFREFREWSAKQQYLQNGAAGKPLQDTGAAQPRAVVGQKRRVAGTGIVHQHLGCSHSVCWCAVPASVSVLLACQRKATFHLRHAA